MGTKSNRKASGVLREESNQEGGAHSLADALFTATQQRVLGILFGQPRRSFFVTELIDLAGTGRGTIQRELSRLERGGLVTIDRRGNQKHFMANSEAPIFEELCSIINKTVGIEEQIRSALSSLEDQIALAFIYGSVAKQSDSASSDIDLLIVSDGLTLENLFTHLSDVEAKLGRQVNPSLYTKKEFSKRKRSGNTFFKRVLSGPVIMLCGDLNEP